MSRPDERVYVDVFGNEIVLSDKVRDLILRKHPETADFIDQIGVVLREPDEIRQSTRDERTALYYRYASEILNGKWLVVVVKRIDRHFISTVYATNKIKAGEVLWVK